MARYIDAESIEYHPQRFFGPPYGGNKYDIVTRSEVEKIPTADVAEVKHGHWLKQNNSSYSPFDGSPPNWFICSECGRHEEKPEPYCNCGVKMDQEEVKI